MPDAPRINSDVPESVLVTGAAGFVGSRVVQQLLDRGRPVVALVRSTPCERLAQVSSVVRNLAAQIEVVACDLHNTQATAGVIERTKPSACIHAAWDVRSANYRHDGANQRWVKSSLCLFNALRSNGCRWIGVIGTCVEPRDREAPTCRYSAAKSTLRHRLIELASFDRDRAMALCWWKLFQPYGPGEPAQRLIPTLVASLQQRQRFEIHNPYDVRDFIHVDDVASAIVASLASNLSGVFDLGTGAGHSIADVAEFVARELDARDLLHFDTGAPGAGPALIANSQDLMAALSWKPQRELQSAIADLIDDLPADLKAVA